LLTSVNIYSGDIILDENMIAEKAMQNNPELIAAEKMAKSYEAKSHKQFFFENPMIGIEYMGINDSSINLNTSMEQNIAISQKIPFPLKWMWKIGAGIEESNYYKYMYEMKKFEILSASKIAYYELFRTIKFIEITREILSLLKQLADIAFVKYNQGMINQFELSKMDIEKDILENDLIVLKREKEIKIQNLRKIISDQEFLKENFSVKEINIPEIRYTFEELKEIALKKSPFLKAKKSLREASFNMRNMAISDYLPDFNVQLKKQISPAINEYSIMFEAEIPLWFLNNQQADISEKWEMAESKQKEYENAINEIIYKVKEHYEIIKSNNDSIDLYKNKIIPRLNSVVESAMTSYKNKKIEFMTLLDSERMLLDAKKQYYMLVVEYLIHFRMLEELTGSLE
jgi:outer membrane protein TolC